MGNDNRENPERPELYKVHGLIRLNCQVQELKDKTDGTAMNADGKSAKKIGF